MRYRILAGLAWAGALSAAWGQIPEYIKAEKSDPWSNLFARTQGWTGGDGIFAIPLTGYEGPDHATRHLFLFSDSFIGSVDSATGARRNTALVNNTLAVLDGPDPDPAKVRFLWGKNAQGGATAVFVPDLPSTAGKKAWYWLQDGFYHKGNVYILPVVVEENPSGPAGFKFKVSGIGLIRLPIGAEGEPDVAHYTQVETPLYYSSGKTFYYGCGIMSNTAEAGAPDPDGYVYVYGRPNLYVARVQPDEFEDFSKWRFWDGTDWSREISASASLGLGGSELSVSPVTQGSLKGKYLMFSQGLEQNAFVRIGSSPRGPFSDRINIYAAPEWHAPQASVYTYNAKAHPSLSSNGVWLVSYNVNTSDLSLNVANADIYHPRFIKVRFDPPASVRRDAALSPAGRGGRMAHLWISGSESGTPLGWMRAADGAWRAARMDGRAVLRVDP